jgi:hypothetical protein
LSTATPDVLNAAAKEIAKKSAEAEVKAGRRAHTRVIEARPGFLSWSGETVELNLLMLPGLV